jgi:hypothetical protein
VDLVRRGTVGVALFVTGVFAMPAVAALGATGARNGASDTDTILSGARPTTAVPRARRSHTAASLTSSATTGPRAARSAASPAFAATRPLAAPAAGVTPRVLGVVGVRTGARLSGVVAIGVSTQGALTGVEYTLTGANSAIAYTAYQAPWAFTPDDAGWDTRRLPNGVYTLVARPLGANTRPVTVTFWVANPASTTVTALTQPRR